MKSQSVFFAIVVGGLVSMVAGCAPSADNAVSITNATVSAATQQAETPAFKTNASGDLHNSTMLRVYSRLGGRKPANQRELCNAILDVVVAAPEIKNENIRKAMIRALFDDAPSNSLQRSESPNSHRRKLGAACRAVVLERLPISIRANSENPCSGDCGGGDGGSGGGGPTFAISSGAASRSDQIIAAAIASETASSLDAALTTLTTTGTSGFNVVDMAMLNSHASLARASFAEALEAEGDFGGECTTAQKKAKARTIRDADATTFIGAIGAAVGVSWLGTAIAWQPVFVGATVAAGAVSAYVTAVEVSTPCS